MKALTANLQQLGALAQTGTRGGAWNSRAVLRAAFPPSQALTRAANAGIVSLEPLLLGSPSGQALSVGRATRSVADDVDALQEQKFQERLGDLRREVEIGTALAQAA